MSILLQMIFCHILDDFVLQSAWLANGKQRSWWEKNAPEPMYKYDYIVALLAHSFSWTFMMMLPIMIANHGAINDGYIMYFIGNVFIHAMTDNLKANVRLYNLIIDQSVHLTQIILTYFVLVVS